MIRHDGVRMFHALLLVSGGGAATQYIRPTGRFDAGAHKGSFIRLADIVLYSYLCTLFLKPLSGESAPVMLWRFINKLIK